VLFFVSGWHAIVYTFLTNGKIQIDGNPKLTMLGGIASFILFLSFLGFYFWTRIDYAHYKILWWIGTTLVLSCALGLQALWNFGNS